MAARVLSQDILNQPGHRGEAATDMFASYGAGSALSHISRTNRRAKVLDFVKSGGPSGIRTQDRRIKVTSSRFISAILALP